MGRPQRPSRKGLGKKAIDGIPIRKGVPAEPGASGKSGDHSYCLTEQRVPSGALLCNRLPGLQQEGGVGGKEGLSYNEKFKLHL